uniref:Protein-tyrosine-phosphatase n=1 Tax=Caenorhabditis japonica TaxID=281687 RepID=A0A8R1HK07_CAEJA
MSSKIKKRKSTVREKERSQKTSGMDETTGADRKRDRKLIVKFVSKALEKGPTGLRSEFATMKRFNDFTKMKAFKEAQEFGKNRYKDVGCLDNNRVKLGSPWPHEYIHANYVAVPSNSKRFICTQAPLEKTCADFWFMCLQDHVENIFMLCNYTEKGAKKCFEYFPTEEKQDTLTFKEKGQKISVKFDSSNPIKFREDSAAKVTKTVLKVEGPDGASLKTNHYHWIDWPDRGVPTADAAILDLLDKARSSKSPIVVHCSAGIGRTGSVVMIEYVMDQLLSGQTIDESDKILQKIREQRNNSVQTDHQYLFVHQVMLNYFKNKNLLDSATAGFHTTFTKEYDTCVL